MVTSYDWRHTEIRIASLPVKMSPEPPSRREDGYHVTAYNAIICGIITNDTREVS